MVADDILRDIMSLLNIRPLTWGRIAGVSFVRFNWQGKSYRLTLREVND